MEVATTPSAHHKLCSVGSPGLVVQALLARTALPSRVALLAPSVLSLRQAAHVEVVGLVASLRVLGDRVDLAEDLVVIKHPQSNRIQSKASIFSISLSSVLVPAYYACELVTTHCWRQGNSPKGLSYILNTGTPTLESDYHNILREGSVVNSKAQTISKK